MRVTYHTIMVAYLAHFGEHMPDTMQFVRAVELITTHLGTQKANRLFKRIAELAEDRDLSKEAIADQINLEKLARIDH